MCIFRIFRIFGRQLPRGFRLSGCGSAVGHPLVASRQNLSTLKQRFSESGVMENNRRPSGVWMTVLGRSEVLHLESFQHMEISFDPT
jgi:hypothetical protein